MEKAKFSQILLLNPLHTPLLTPSATPLFTPLLIPLLAPLLASLAVRTGGREQAELAPQPAQLSSLPFLLPQPAHLVLLILLPTCTGGCEQAGLPSLSAHLL